MREREGDIVRERESAQGERERESPQGARESEGAHRAGERTRAQGARDAHDSGEEDGGGTRVAVEEERVEYITSLMRAANESALWLRV